MTTYINTLAHPTLGDDEIIKYSLGIPLLAQQLALRGLTADPAARIPAKYLTESFRHTWKRSLLVAAAKPYL